MPRLLPCLSTAAACVAFLGVAGLIVERSTHEPTTTTVVAAANAIPYGCGGKHLAGADEEPEFYMTEEGTCYTPADRNNPCFVHDEQYLRPCPSSANDTRRLAEGTAMMHDDADPTMCPIYTETTVGSGRTTTTRTLSDSCLPSKLMGSRIWYATDAREATFRLRGNVVHDINKDHVKFTNFLPLYSALNGNITRRYCNGFSLTCAGDRGAKDARRSVWLWNELDVSGNLVGQYLVNFKEQNDRGSSSRFTMQYCRPQPDGYVQCRPDNQRVDSKANVVYNPINSIIRYGEKYCRLIRHNSIRSSGRMLCDQDAQSSLLPISDS